MSKPILNISLLFVLSTHALAVDSYVIKKGDTLSNIVQNLFPENRIYGRKGKLAEVLALNPQIGNPHSIEPDQIIYLERRVASTDQKNEEPLVNKEIKAIHIDRGLVRDFWIWVGAGVNFTSYNQTVPGISDVNFGRINTTSIMAKGGFLFAENFGLDLGYRTAPGKVEAGTTIDVRDGEYDWKVMSAELLYRLSVRERSEWLIRTGIFQHQNPFIVPLNINRIGIQKNNLTLYSISAEYRKLTPKNIRVEAVLGYQHPLSSSTDAGENFEIDSKFTFYGSFGAAYGLSKNTYLGVYWDGQYHSYKFDYKSNNSSFSGSQSLFYSNFDIRLGVEF